MNLFTAINFAADHIERNPDEFDFCEYAIPPRCGTPACAIGWIAYFMKYTGGVYWVVDEAAVPVLGITENDFYDRMESISFALFLNKEVWNERAWHCAVTLRAYADKYHALPESVREMFDDEFIDATESDHNLEVSLERGNAEVQS